MDVVFLDIDGVLNNTGTRDKLRAAGHTGYLGRTLDPDNCAALSWLLRESRASVVISSAWRCPPPEGKCGTRWFREYLPSQGVSPIKVIGCTPELWSRRDREIEAWLQRTRFHVRRFVALDDEDHIRPEWLVRTDWQQGLTMQDAQDALRRLQGTSHPSSSPVGEGR